MSNKDLYSILEISNNASAEEIKSSYRRLALKYHPDTNNGGDDSEERFKAINEAYSVLGDKNKRKRYDLGGYDFLKEIRGQDTPYGFQGRMGRFGSFGCMGRGMGLGACFNRRSGGFGRAFRHPFSRYQYERGAVYDIPLTRDEALKGTEKVVNLYSGSIKNTIKVKTPSDLKDGDFLIMKNGNSRKLGEDIYLRVKLVD